VSEPDGPEQRPPRRRVRTLRRVRSGTPRHRRPGATLDCLVLACGPEEWAAVDLASGALVRARHAAPGEPPPLGEGWHPLDIARVVIADDGEPVDPARPEAITPAGPPSHLGHLRRRPGRRLLRRLASPERPGASLLGTHGPSIAYLDLDGSSPSLMLIAVSHRSLEAFATSAEHVQLAFSWSGTRHQLPVLDDRLRAAALVEAPRSLAGARLAAALGGKASLLLVGLGAVRAGHVPKVVLAALSP